jgi:cell surface protein SprA
MKGSQQGISNDLTLNTEVSFQNTQALMRKIENNYTQATSGTRTLNINFTASYVMSKKITLSAYFDHQVNTPLVTTSSYPTTNTSYGVSINMSLTR